MTTGTVNWSSTDTWQRLMASAVATGVKLDLREMAKYYGTTYDTLQNRFRIINKEAAALKEAVEKGTTAPATPAKNRKSTPSTPKSSAGKKDRLHSVASSRVAKSSATKKGIKKESESDEDDDFN